MTHGRVSECPATLNGELSAPEMAAAVSHKVLELSRSRGRRALWSLLSLRRRAGQCRSPRPPHEAQSWNPGCPLRAWLCPQNTLSSQPSVCSNATPQLFLREAPPEERPPKDI